MSTMAVMEWKYGFKLWDINKIVFIYDELYTWTV